jgi:Fe-S-cluster containining protein
VNFSSHSKELKDGDGRIGSSMRNKLEKLAQIYDRFSEETNGFLSNAACDKGCAFCCTQAGSIDITTLEGLQIRGAINRMPRRRQTETKKALAKEIKKREAGNVVACPFLQKNKTCMIYAVRPFACRRIYSLHRCSPENPPRLSRHYMAVAQETLKTLQRLDEHGYSGHISYILHMLDASRFLETYLDGEFKPEEIMTFGKTHRIFINQIVAG